MSVIGTFTVPADAFALGRALASDSTVTLEAERLATHNTDTVLPFLWATGGDLAAFRGALEADPTVERATIAEELDRSALYQIQWSEEFKMLIDDMIDHHATILEATADADGWRLKLRFVEEGHVSLFQKYFADNDRNFELRRLYHPKGPREREFDLTPEQRETLVVALREGYFDVPRGISIEELGERLGVSANAVSQRIRRASANLIRNALTIDSE
jgi:predicted DNA binding protein